MTRNALLPSSNYCQKIGKKSDFKGQLSWTNVFREEIEILQMKGKYVLNVPQLEMIFLTQNGKVDSNTPQSSYCKVAATITCSAKFNKHEIKQKLSTPIPLRSIQSSYTFLSSNNLTVGITGQGFFTEI